MDNGALKLMFFIALAVIMYILYRNGYMHTQSKSAIMYIGSAYDKSATFDSCNGYTRCPVRFEKSGVLHFTFWSELSAGNVTAELLDAKKQPILRLSNVDPTADVHVEAKKMYYLMIRFQSATGKYQIDWE